MEKNKICFWFLILFSFSLNFAESKIPYQKGYIRFSDLKKAFPELNLNIDSSILKTEIKVKSNQGFQFLLDSKFFSYKGLIEPITKPAIYIKKELYLPREIVENIFIHLIETEISYRFSEEELFVQKDEKPIIVENIPIKYIIIDPGHGGKDPGAIAVNGEYEKTYTLKIAKILKKFLKEKFPKTKIRLTRKKDEYMSLEDRALIANKKLKKSKDVLFISLHCNSTQNPENSPTGFEIYYLAQTAPMENSRQSKLISARLVDTNRDQKVQEIQSGMMSSSIQRKSIHLAKNIDSKLKENLGDLLMSRGVKRNNFHVLRGSIMPSVLIELGFITNQLDVKMLEEKSVQIKLAKGIAEGIKLYANTKN